MGTGEAASLSLDISLVIRLGKRGCNGNFIVSFISHLKLATWADSLMDLTDLTTRRHTMASD